MTGEPRAGLSALLPMGGAVSGVAGPNWMLIGDAAACVNPLNGEGIDYGLETGQAGRRDAGRAAICRRRGRPCCRSTTRAAFSVARRLALLLTIPRFLPSTGPLAMRSAFLMNIAVRVMGNLVTDEDADWIARVWRRAVRVSRRDRPSPAVQLVPASWGHSPSQAGGYPHPASVCVCGRHAAWQNRRTRTLTQDERHDNRGVPSADAVAP